MVFHQHRPTIIYEDCEVAVAFSKETRFLKEALQALCTPLVLHR
jgi:hypothetical protein